MYDKVFNNAKNSKYDEYQRSLASMVCKFFDKKEASFPNKSASGAAVKNENMSSQRPLDLATR